MDAACLPADALVRERLAELCLLALADARPALRERLALEAGSGAMDRLAETLATGRG